MHAVRLFDERQMAERAVVMIAEALADTRAAFDGVAREYDRTNRENSLLAAMRARTIRVVAAHVPPGGRVLDLGCGPGTDAVTLAARGFRITAVDWSPRMVEEARQRVRDAGLEHRVTVRLLGIQELDGLEAGGFDLACANFGPFNCVPDLAAAAAAVASRLRPGGVVVASVIGRICPWEIACYLRWGDWNRIAVRYARRPVPVPLNGERVWTRYYTPGEFERAFVPAGFTRESLRTLGLLVPPPYMSAFADRHPRLIGTLQRLEDAVGGLPFTRAAGDHFLMVLRKPR